MNILAGLKAATKSLFTGGKAQSFRMADKHVVCPHCANILFHKRKASLNTSGSEITGTQWTDHQASVLVCANCTHLEWFYDEPVAEE